MVDDDTVIEEMGEDTPAAAADVLTPATMHNIAVLGDEGILVGYETVDEVPPGAVEIPNMDLAVGRYRWDGSSMVPIPRQRLSALPEEWKGESPPFELAVTEFMRMFGASMQLPPATQQYLDWYEVTLRRTGKAKHPSEPRSQKRKR